MWKQMDGIVQNIPTRLNATLVPSCKRKTLARALSSLARLQARGSNGQSCAPVCGMVTALATTACEGMIIAVASALCRPCCRRASAHMSAGVSDTTWLGVGAAATGSAAGSTAADLARMTWEAVEISSLMAISSAAARMLCTIFVRMPL